MKVLRALCRHCSSRSGGDDDGVEGQSTKGRLAGRTCSGVCGKAFSRQWSAAQRPLAKGWRRSLDTLSFTRQTDCATCGFVGWTAMELTAAEWSAESMPTRPKRTILSARMGGKRCATGEKPCVHQSSYGWEVGVEWRPAPSGERRLDDCPCESG